MNLAIAITLWTIGALAARRIIYVTKPGNLYQFAAVWAVITWLIVAGTLEIVR